MSFVIKRFVCLCNNVVILDIRGKIYHLVGYNSAFFINYAIRCLDKAVVADFCICCKIRDKTDVRTFGCFDRTHSAVVSIMDVTDIKGCAVTGKTAGTECRKTALMCKL